MSYRTTNEVILESGVVVADEQSDAIDISNQMIWSAQVEHTSTTCAATLKMQHSNDNSTWIDISGASVTVNNDSTNTMLSSGAGFEGAKYIRFVVDWTSGSLTTVKCTINCKG
jgi:hypothetical protein